MANVSGRTPEGGKFELDNQTYDLIAILHEKSKGLEAMDRYVRDFQGENQIKQELEKIREEDKQHIRRLERFLHDRLMARVSPGEIAA